MPIVQHRTRRARTPTEQAGDPVAENGKRDQVGIAGILPLTDPDPRPAAHRCDRRSRRQLAGPRSPTRDGVRFSAAASLITAGAGYRLARRR